MNLYDLIFHKICLQYVPLKPEKKKKKKKKYIYIYIYIYVSQGWNDTCIQTEQSRYGHIGSVHEALQRIQAIHPQSRRGRPQ